jgi:hypothetical protein
MAACFYFFANTQESFHELYFSGRFFLMYTLFSLP